jgi:hypothetical protein
LRDLKRKSHIWRKHLMCENWNYFVFLALGASFAFAGLTDFAS